MNSNFTANIKKLRNSLTKVLNFLLIVAVAFLVLDVVLGVFSRYILSEQVKWTEELARYLLIWISLLGGAVAFSTKGHLGVDYFTEKLSPAAAKCAAVFVHLTVLFFAASIFIYGGGKLVSDTLAVEQITPALGWQMGYVYLAVPLSGFFIIMYTIENLIETWKTPIPEITNQENLKEAA